MVRRIIPSRRPVFLGCEGESEQAYCIVLGDIIKQTVNNVHLEAMLLGEGAGNPLAKMKKAIKKIEQYERTRSKFWKKAVLIDSDLIDHDLELKILTENLASSRGIRIIWQQPCHEAFLLRHLPNCSQLRPPTSVLATRELMVKWQNYKKPMSGIQIAKSINRVGLEQASSVEAEFRGFLNDLGWQ
jgi:hypothetical protein